MLWWLVAAGQWNMVKGADLQLGCHPTKQGKQHCCSSPATRTLVKRFRMRRIKMMVLFLSNFANFHIHWSPFPVRHSLRISPVIQVHPSSVRTRHRLGGTSTGSTNHFSRSFLSRIVHRVSLRRRDSTLRELFIQLHRREVREIDGPKSQGCRT